MVYNIIKKFVYIANEKGIFVSMDTEINFEKAIEELESIANELESGKLNLDDSIKKFEDGMKLSKKCSEYLENAEKKISVLLEKDGEISEEKFES